MKAISLDNLKRFYDKCKDVFVGKEELNKKQDQLIAGDNITIENNIISASGSGTKEVHVGNHEPTDGEVLWIDPDEQIIVQTIGTATDKVMSQDAVTKALASAGGGEWEFVTQFTAGAGSIVGLVEDASIYSELHITLERNTAGPANNSTYIYFGNSKNGAYFPVNVLLIHWHLWFFYGQAFGIYASSTVSSKVLNNIMKYLYYPKNDGAMRFYAGTTVFDGTELITIYGKKKRND